MSFPADRICAIIGRSRHKMVAVEMEEAVRQGAQLIELRLDHLARSADFKRLASSKGCPLIVTVRRPADGGRWSGDEEARQLLLRRAIVSDIFEWVDLETDVADEIKRFGNVKRIISYHNLAEVPPDLEGIYETMTRQDPDVIKIAVNAQQPTDNLRVLKLVKTAKKPTLAICMGEIGFPTRVLALKYGAPWAYAAFNKERGIAPGLPSMDELRKVYPNTALNPDTEVFGVIGDPVAHSLSPQLFNNVFKRQGINAVYVPFRVPRGELSGFLRAFAELPVRGYSVTIPHKEAAAAVAQQADPSVDRTRAANTLVYRDDKFFASNTDLLAVIELLGANLPVGADGQPRDLGSLQALVLGAGGVARSVAHALHQEGCGVTLASRTLERAAALAVEIGGKSVDWVARHNIECDLLVNCTPVGMHPNVDESPIHASFLRPGLVVFDTVYTPETTLLIKESRLRGCQVITGVEMFVRQAGYQFQRFFERQASLDLMGKIVRRALSPVNIDDD
jgi:3-dehydroquinate dehydratase/shikimate dehydrogenase